jgi:enoyl-CoA hydratase/carnithine racemase
VATLTLNRPEALNALTPALFVELRAHVDALAGQTDDVGVVVLRGNGRSFCAGNDLDAIARGERPPSRHHQALTIEAMERLPQPVVVSVHGHCYTGGLELALGGDLLICSENARFADTHGKFALTPIWGMSVRLPARIGPLRAREIMFSGRVVEGREAALIGLANRCVHDDDLVSATDEWAAELAAMSWHTLRGDKMLLREAAQLPYEEALQWERDHSPGVGPDMAERIAAFRRK